MREPGRRPRRRRRSDQNLTAQGVEGATEQPSILFVDDDEALGRAFARRFRREGFEVVVTNSPIEAIKLSQRRLFSTVVTDLRMPVMSGAEMIEHVAGVQPDVSFVVVTGVPNLDLDRSPPAELSTVGIVAKPWDDDELLSVIRRAVELTTRRRAETSASRGVDPLALVVEDDPDDAALLVTRLRRCGWRSQVVHRLQEARLVAGSASFDAMLVDLSLPDARGLDAVVRLRQVAPQVPLIVFSGMDDDTTARQAIRAGAHDFLVKGKDEPRLGRALVLGVERSHYTRRLTSLAHYDQLTGLANRLTLREAVRRAQTAAAVSGHATALLYVDLDRFKTVNDSLGHEAGDALLQKVADRLRASIRDDDTAARLGGDEFAIVLRQLDQPDEASIVAERLLDALRAPFELPQATVRVTCSVGVVVKEAGEQATLDDLLRQADMAMYDAKRSGRNRLARPRQRSERPGVARIALENELRDAVAEERFSLVYQPQFALPGPELCGYEALLRWTRLDGTRVSPGTFIPLLEDMGLVTQVGRWVLRESCRQLAEWRRRGLPGHVRMAVNVSGQDFERDDLVGSVRRALDEHGIEPSALELEITESILMRDTERTNVTLEALKREGVPIAIDDFGTGYSSLAYLQRFAVSRLKIDRVFVQTLEGDAEGTIAEAVIALGHRMGMEVLAEGVETEAQLRFLKSVGCDMVQGFLLGRPEAEPQIALVA
ncbi:MAG: EAL domain-containing protein [Myxococcota bacterium]|nr:EAL domain-containing protein [Myxococcota bacterium]